MSWTSPMTWVAAIVTVPDMNREIRDNLSALHPAIVNTSVDYTVTTADGHHVVVMMTAAGGARNVTLYTASGNAGALITVKKIDTSVNAVTIVATIDGVTNRIVTAQDEAVTLVSNGTTWQVYSICRRPRYLATAVLPYTVTVGDDVVEVTTGTGTVNLHSANENGRYNRPLTIKNSGTGIVTVDAQGVETIDALSTIDLAANDGLVIVTTLTKWLIV